MAAKNAGHKLYGIWCKKYMESHGEMYVGSRYRDAAMLKAIADDFDEHTIRELMDYYFERKTKHDFTDFIFNYPELMREKRARERDLERQQRIRERTRERLREEGIEL